MLEWWAKCHSALEAKVERQRVRFVIRDALNWTQKEIAYGQEKMCDATKVDVRARQVVTGIQVWRSVERKM